MAHMQSSTVCGAGFRACRCRVAVKRCLIGQAGSGRSRLTSSCQGAGQWPACNALMIPRACVGASWSLRRHALRWVAAHGIAMPGVWQHFMLETCCRCMWRHHIKHSSAVDIVGSAPCCVDGGVSSSCVLPVLMLLWLCAALTARLTLSWRARSTPGGGSS